MEDYKIKAQYYKREAQYYKRQVQLCDDLFDAIEEQDLKQVSQLIESGCDLSGNSGAFFTMV